MTQTLAKRRSLARPQAQPQARPQAQRHGGAITKALAMAALAAISLAAFSPSLRAQDAPKVIKGLTFDETEELLRGLNIEFKKSVAPKGNVASFDYKKRGLEIRLTNFGEKDLMLDCLFKPLPLDKVNLWNIRAKFSRVNLQKMKVGEVTILEWNIDLSGGVTMDAVKRFILQYDTELDAYDRFITEQGGGRAPQPAGDAATTKIIAKVSHDNIDRVLKSLNLEYKKNEGQNNLTTYDFELNSFKLRLYNFGGDDLMVDAQFKAIPLESVNKYNLDRKFIRAVLYQTANRNYTSLEANLDCAGGVSESIIRHFVAAFGEDVKNFATFLRDVKE